VPHSDEVVAAVKVSGPSWIKAERVVLYANGIKIREENIENTNATGIKWNGTWSLTMPTHDVFLVAVAQGPDPEEPYWPIAKPYQPTSTDWSGAVMGISGAVWLDGDRNGKQNSARTYAENAIRHAGSDLSVMMKNLSSFDEAVAIQAAALLHRKGLDLSGSDITKALKRATPEVRTAFQRVINHLQSIVK
jgi:hypothetical protein